MSIPAFAVGAPLAAATAGAGPALEGRRPRVASLPALVVASLLVGR